MNRTIRYKGYEVAPAAARLPNGLFAANLTIEKASGGPSPRAVSFDAIDFFFEEEHALATRPAGAASGSTRTRDARLAGVRMAARKYAFTEAMQESFDP